jgi:hypothetical protein
MMTSNEDFMTFLCKKNHRKFDIGRRASVLYALNPAFYVQLSVMHLPNMRVFNAGKKFFAIYVPWRFGVPFSG